MRWPWNRPEERSSTFEGLVTDSIVAAATGGETENADGLAALEAAAGLIGRCFAGAEVTGDKYNLVAPWVLELIGRELVRRGEAVFAIEGLALPRLVPGGTWDIRGSEDPRGWYYRVDTFGASEHRTRLVPGASVIHARINVDPVRPWLGRAPHRIASTTATTAARAERSAGAEAKIPSTRIAPVPSPDEAQRTAFGAKLRAGGVVAVAAGASPVAGAGQEPASRWTPAIMRPDPASAHVELRSRSANDVLASIGVPASLFDPWSDGTATRESYRQLVLSTLQPWGKIIQSELADKLDSPDLRLSFAGLHGADLATRGRALRTMVDAGVPLAEALRLVDLDG